LKILYALSLPNPLNKRGLPQGQSARRPSSMNSEPRLFSTYCSFLLNNSLSIVYLTSSAYVKMLFCALFLNCALPISNIFTHFLLSPLVHSVRNILLSARQQKSAGTVQGTKGRSQSQNSHPPLPLRSFSHCTAMLQTTSVQNTIRQNALAR
jgi:hypothetical protein